MLLCVHVKPVLDCGIAKELNVYKRKQIVMSQMMPFQHVWHKELLLLSHFFSVSSPKPLLTIVIGVPRSLEQIFLQIGNKLKRTDHCNCSFDLQEFV